MADTEIFKAGQKAPEDIDGFFAPPKGFKHFADASRRDPMEWAKTVISANFPAVMNIQIFHEEKSDMGGNMIIRFMHNGKPINIPVSNQQIINTLTPAQYSNLSPHIQHMSPMERGIFNITLQHVNKLEQAHKSVKKTTHAEIENLNADIQSA